MRVTETRINFELINIEAQNNCTFTSSGAKNFSNLSLLNIQSKIQKPFVTLELNQGVLNGSLRNFKSNEQRNIGFFSNNTSNGNCKFTDVWAKASLGNQYNFIGVTLDFGEFYPKKVTVEYYKNNVKMASKTIDEIDETWAFFNLKAINIDEVKVIFEESWAPYQYANLQELLLGDIIEWTTEHIVNSNLQEETDIISKVIPNDTLSLTIYSKDEDFNILNPKNSYGYLLPNQKLTVTEIIREIDEETKQEIERQEISMGQFYLDKWESINRTQIKFNLVSPLAQLDKTQFKKSNMYTGTATSATAFTQFTFLFCCCFWLFAG